MDFSRLEDERGWNAFAAALEGIDIGVLGASHNIRAVILPLPDSLKVNNVGKSHTAPVYFAEAAEKEVEDILRINVNANVRVTKLILPRMVER